MAQRDIAAPVAAVDGRNPLIKDTIPDTVEACRDYAEWLASGEDMPPGLQLGQAVLWEALRALGEMSREAPGRR